MLKHVLVLLISAVTLHASDGPTPPRRPSNPHIFTPDEQNRKLLEELTKRQDERMVLLMELLEQAGTELIEENETLIKKLEEALNTLEKEKNGTEK